MTRISLRIHGPNRIISSAIPAFARLTSDAHTDLRSIAACNRTTCSCYRLNNKLFSDQPTCFDAPPGRDRCDPKQVALPQSQICRLARSHQSSPRQQAQRKQAAAAAAAAIAATNAATSAVPIAGAAGRECNYRKKGQLSGTIEAKHEPLEIRRASAPLGGRTSRGYRPPFAARSSQSAQLLSSASILAYLIKVYRQTAA